MFNIKPWEKFKKHVDNVALISGMCLTSKLSLITAYWQSCGERRAYQVNQNQS